MKCTISFPVKANNARAQPRALPEIPPDFVKTPGGFLGLISSFIIAFPFVLLHTCQSANTLKHGSSSGLIEHLLRTSSLQSWASQIIL